MYFLQGVASHGEVSVGAELGHTLLPTLRAMAPGPVAAVFSCSGGSGRQGSGFLQALGRACCPHPSWRARRVFVIVTLAHGQAWLGASLVGTVCTVSAEPSLSSYTINFFFF